MYDGSGEKENPNESLSYHFLVKENTVDKENPSHILQHRPDDWALNHPVWPWQQKPAC